MIVRRLRPLAVVLPLSYMLLIWILSSHPADAFVNTGWSFDHQLKESLHLVEFGILYGLWYLTFHLNGGVDRGRNILAAVLAIAYGAADEIHQYFVPQRSCSWFDFAKDIIGVLVFMTVLGYFRKRKTKQEFRKQ